MRSRTLERSPYRFDPTAHEAIERVDQTRKGPSSLREITHPSAKDSLVRLTKWEIDEQLRKLNLKFPNERKKPDFLKNPEYVRLRAEVENQRARMLLSQS